MINGKMFWVIWSVYVVVWLSILVGITITAVHFIAKYW